MEPGDKRRECFRCGAEVTGAGPDLKHWDENIRTTPVPREYLAAVREASRVGAAALGYVTERATDEERARVVAVALVAAGFLRQKPVKAKKP